MPTLEGQVVFITAGVIDSGVFKGAHAIDEMRAKLEADMTRYTSFARRKRCSASARRNPICGLTMTAMAVSSSSVRATAAVRADALVAKSRSLPASSAMISSAVRLPMPLSSTRKRASFDSMAWAICPTGTVKAFDPKKRDTNQSE